MIKKLFAYECIAVKIAFFFRALLVGISLMFAAGTAFATCTAAVDRNTDQIYALSQVLLHKNVTASCGYLDTPYGFVGLGAHAGIDFPENTGTPVYSATDGVVVNTVPAVGHVAVRLSDSRLVNYYHMNTILVSNGAQVFRGDQVGTVGQKGLATGPHLHIEVRTNYNGSSAIGGAYCGGTCSYAQISTMTDNPVSLVTNTGRALVSQLSVPSSIVLGKDFNITVNLKEVNGAAITFDTVAIKIRRADGTDAFDFKNFGSVTVPANGTWSQTVAGQLYAASWPAGTYKAVVRGNVNGMGFDFNTTESGVNPVSFTASAIQSASEIDTLVNSSHQTSWAYFQDLGLSKWFISSASGVTYGLGQNSKGHAAWISIGNEAQVASVDFYNKKVSVTSNTNTSSESYKATSLVGGEGSEWMYSAQANNWARLIEGATMPAKWHFFQVSSSGKWYIIQIEGTDSTIYRLNLTSDNSNYDWKKPVDASGNEVDTSGWRKSFHQDSSGKWMVSFTK